MQVRRLAGKIVVDASAVTWQQQSLALAILPPFANPFPFSYSIFHRGPPRLANFASRTETASPRSNRPRDKDEKSRKRKSLIGARETNRLRKKNEEIKEKTFLRQGKERYQGGRNDKGNEEDVQRERGGNYREREQLDACKIPSGITGSLELPF